MKGELVYLLAILIFCAVTAAIVSSCNERVIKPPVGGGGVDPVDPADIDYDRISQTVLTPYCIQCHNPQIAIAGVDVSSYEGAKAVGDKLCTVVTNERMPPSDPLPGDLISDLCEWVSSGHPRLSPSQQWSTLVPIQPL